MSKSKFDQFIQSLQSEYDRFNAILAGAAKKSAGEDASDTESREAFAKAALEDFNAASVSPKEAQRLFLKIAEDCNELIGGFGDRLPPALSCIMVLVQFGEMSEDKLSELGVVEAAADSAFLTGIALAFGWLTGVYVGQFVEPNLKDTFQGYLQDGFASGFADAQLHFDEPKCPQLHKHLIQAALLNQINAKRSKGR